MIRAIRAAQLTSPFRNVKLKRCFWHLVHQEFTKIFGNGEQDSEINRTIRGWVNSLAYRVETEDDFNESIALMKKWVAVNVDSSRMPRKAGVQISRRERMLQFVDKVGALYQTRAKCRRMGLTDLGHITTSLSESGFAKLKGGKIAVHAQMGIDVTTETMRKQDKLSMHRSQLRAQRNLCSHLCEPAANCSSHRTRRIPDT